MDNTLDSFYETNQFAPPPDASFFHTSPPCVDYQEIRKQLFEFAMTKKEEAEQGIVTEHIPLENMEELEEIRKYTKKGFDKLLTAIRDYMDLQVKKSDLQACIDRIYKSRTDAIFAVRRIGEGSNDETVAAISKSIEDLITNQANLKQAEIDKIQAEINRNRAIIAYFEEAYKLHKDIHSYSPCPMCMTSEVSLFMIPCGHTACKDCVSKNESRNGYRCPVCRAHYQTHGKLFM